MTYIAEKPVTETKERPLITIEFAPDIHPSETQYSYEHPLFVFGDQLRWCAERNRVELINSFPTIEYTVCALELIESKTPSGRLLNQPRWKYKISNGEVSFWKDESALVRWSEQSPTSTIPALTASTFKIFMSAIVVGVIVLTIQLEPIISRLMIAFSIQIRKK